MNLPTETSIHAPNEFGFWIDTRERTDLDYMTRLEQVLSIAKSLVAQWAEIAQIPHSGKEPFFRQLDFGNATADFKNVLLAEVLKRWMRREGMAVKSSEQSETSTLLQERPEEVDNKIVALFEAAKEEIFEDGMESK